MEWISCQDRLPETNRPVLIWTEGLSKEISFCGAGSLKRKRLIKWGVTHWMPLPEPPEEPQDDDVYIDIGYRQNTPEQNYKLREVRLKDVQDKTMAEIYKMLEDTEDESTSDN